MWTTGAVAASRRDGVQRHEVGEFAVGNPQHHRHLVVIHLERHGDDVIAMPLGS
jgi:hypothetical protein